MLEYLRNMSNKPIAKVLIGILMFSFVGWGVAEWVLSSNVRTSALIKVGSSEVTANEFNVERSRAMARLSREEQKRIYTDSAAAKVFYSEILTDMTNKMMVLNRAHDLKFVVTDKRVAAEIKSYPEFQEDGVFSAYMFDMILNNSGFTEATFANFLRGDILRGYVLGGISMPVSIPDFAVTAAYNARYATRVIDFYTIKYSQFDVGNPTDEQLREYYAKNPKINPETRTVSYVLVPADMDKPDSYDAGYVMAQKLEDAIISGESMDASAKNIKAKYVSMPAFARDKKHSDKIMTDTMVAKVFSLEQGLESEIIETKEGFVIIRVEKITPQHTAEFDSVKKDLIAGWRAEEQKKRAYLVANESLSALNGNGDFKGAKRNVSVTRTSGAPTDVLVAAFRQDVGSNSIVPGADAFHVLRINKEVAPKADAAKMANIKKDLATMTMRGLMDDYNSFLIRTYPVKMNSKAFEKLFAK